MNRGLRLSLLIAGGTAVVGAPLGYLFLHRGDSAEVSLEATPVTVESAPSALRSDQQPKVSSGNISGEVSGEDAASSGRRMVSDPKKSDADRTAPSDEDVSTNNDRQKFSSDDDDDKETDDGVSVEVESDD